MDRWLHPTVYHDFILGKTLPENLLPKAKPNFFDLEVMKLSHFLTDKHLSFVPNNYALALRPVKLDVSLGAEWPGWDTFQR